MTSLEYRQELCSILALLPILDTCCSTTSLSSSSGNRIPNHCCDYVDRIIMSRADAPKRFIDDCSVSKSVAYIQKKADEAILKFQQALGRTPSSKGQYMSINHGKTFNKKYVRLLSVFLFLLCVSLSAIVGGIYYMYYWKPCTKRFLFTETTDKCTPTCATNVHEMWTDETFLHKWEENGKCEKHSSEPTCPKFR